MRRAILELWPADPYRSPYAVFSCFYCPRHCGDPQPWARADGERFTWVEMIAKVDHSRISELFRARKNYRNDRLLVLGRAHRPTRGGACV